MPPIKQPMETFVVASQGVSFLCPVRDHAVAPFKCHIKPTSGNKFSTYVPPMIFRQSSVLPQLDDIGRRRGVAHPKMTKQHTVQELSHKATDFHPSIWKDFFLTHKALSLSQYTWMATRAEKLREDVRKMLKNSDQLQQLQLINMLQRLCIDYHFQQEINETLTHVYNSHFDDDNLHTVALRFYLLRRQGWNVSPDLFSKFKDEKGNFLTDNPRDLLMLYNAACLRTHGEIILEEAVFFTKRRLETMVKYMEGPLATEISYALEIPLPRQVRLFMIKDYISMYEQEGTRNGTILEFGKLNFNLVQFQHQQELRNITLWWKELEIESRLSFARDRVVECFFWMAGVYFEPRYSRARVMLTKFVALIPVLDDTYDIRGTPEDCELFTKVIESWDPTEADELPEYMKFIFLKIFNTFKAIEDELEPEEKYRLLYARKLMINVAKSYNQENRWRDEGYVPATIEEHLQVSLPSGGFHQLSCSLLIGMGDIATMQVFDWVISFPKIVQAMCTILRLSDDLKSTEREKQMLHVASAIDSYMKEHKVPFEVACMRIEELIEESWKDINMECLKLVQPMPVLEWISNLARTSIFVYKKDDAYTNAYVLKDIITSLFVDAIPVKETK